MVVQVLSCFLASSIEWNGAYTQLLQTTYDFNHEHKIQKEKTHYPSCDIASVLD